MQLRKHRTASNAVAMPGVLDSMLRTEVLIGFEPSGSGPGCVPEWSWRPYRSSTCPCPPLDDGAGAGAGPEGFWAEPQVCHLDIRGHLQRGYTPSHRERESEVERGVVVSAFVADTAPRMVRLLYDRGPLPRWWCGPALPLARRSS